MSEHIVFASRIATLLLSMPANPGDHEAGTAPASVQAAVGEALARGETHYTDRPGILRLREQIAASLATRFGVAADAKNNLVVTCGVIEARFVALQQLLAPGDTVFAPAHGDRIAGAVLLRRAEIVSDPAGARVIYLTSEDPEATLRQRLASLDAEATVLFEVDETGTGFHPTGLGGLAERTVTVGQIGDTVWQIGFLHSPGTRSAGMRDFKQGLTICSTNLSQWAALAAMESA